MYTEIDREEIMNRIIDHFRNRKEVLALLLVGSASIGFRDRLSDLDFAIVVDNINNIENIFKETKEEISLIRNIVSEEDMKERRLQVFLLDNYLEIDIGYYTLDTLYARREKYRVVFDKTNKVSKIMSDSWEQLKDENKGTTSKVDMKGLIEYIDSILWYNVIHCVNAFYRNNKYRCYYELNDIRNIAIDLMAKREKVESKKHREIELLSDEEKAKIDEMYIYPQNNKELKELLGKLINIIYDIMEYFKKAENINYTISKDFLVMYVDENL